MEKTVDERFWEKVDKSGQCWLWTSAVASGYGVFWLNGGNVKAHRLSWEMANGPIPSGLCVLHRCDVPPCVNPGHLFLGTHADNMTDKIAKDRGYFPGPDEPQRGSKHFRARFVESQVVEIRKRHVKGESLRALAQDYEVGKSTIRNIVNRATWQHVPGGGPDGSRHERKARGESAGKAKLTEAQVIAIRTRKAAGERQMDLAVIFGVSRTAVSDIVTRKSWTHI